ncbi:30864_t:CDS:10 [Gigaspora margarita]|uniref:30864_t:CDS:1 n=1 Tax=Gigaspora margarita TaxID=4874 RepID=A0ABN7V927_GIGMA|nr:30864_t:CDS:10 [Gigaspora margarita]
MIITRQGTSPLVITTLFYIIIYLIIPTQSQSQSQAVFRTATISEPQENGLVFPVNLVTYPNDTIAIRLSQNLSCPISSNFTTIITPLRFIFPNLTLTIANLEYPFDPVNYCPTNLTNTTLSDQINIFAIPDNFLLIRYWIVPNDSPNMVQYYGLIISTFGTIINRDTPVQLSDPISITNATVSNTQITALDFDQKGILFASSFDQTTINWTRFIWDSDRHTLNNSSHDILTAPPNFQIDDFKSFTTIDGGYGLVYCVRLKNQDLLIPSVSIPRPTTLIIFFTTLKSDSLNFSTPVIIYQQTLPETIISLSNCKINSGNRPGCICFIHGQSTPQSLTPGVNFWQLLTFFATGSVISTIDLPNNFVNEADVITYNSAYPLHNGGTLMIGRNQNGTVRGSIFNDNGVFAQDWGLPQSQGMIASYTGSSNSNTVWAVAPSINNSWSVYATELPSLLPSDILLMNPSIEAISPTVNSSIFKNTTSITIVYHQDVSPSIANITIYQHTNGSDNMRQTLSANSSGVHFFSRRAIAIDVLPSTFNQEGANYFIMIDPDFVVLRGLGEPIPGVSNGTWSFFTERTISTFTDNIDVALRLSDTGSTFFENLSEDKKISFYDELIISLANGLSVNVSRLSMQRRFQHDGNAKEPWAVLFRMTLVATSDPEEINTQDMFESLTSLVTNKSITSLMFYNSTAFLDSDYGVQQLKSIWETYRFEIAGVICIIFILFVIIFLSNHTHPEEFYGNDNFHHWARQNAVASSIFIVLSYCDIESLNFVSSDISNSSCVQAPFSQGVYEAMYLCTLFVMFIEDIPQFVILVLYLQRVVIFRFIPLITIFTCALIIVTNIVSHLYDCINMIRDARKDDPSKKTYKKWWQVGKASASKRISSRKHPHFLSGFVPVQPGPTIQVVSPEPSPGS